MSRFLLISELQHFSLTLAIALFLFWRYRDWRLIAVCFFFGFLIDIDHLFDYFAHLGFNFDLLKFFDVENYMVPSGKIYVPLHSWEFIALLWLGGRWLGKKLKTLGLKWAIVIPYLAHLLVDQFLSPYPHYIFAYSLIFRLLNSFSLESFSGL